MAKRLSNRREFISQSASALGASGLLPYLFAGETSAIAQESKSKNDRPTLGAIGVGGQGTGITRWATNFAELVAVCDVDRQHAERGREQLSGGKAEIYRDYRKLLERKDIDAVTIGTPDHWHTKISIEAMQSGKDVYCEKPLTLTIDEGKMICKVVKDTGRVFQVGTQQRSDKPFQTAVAICHEGRIGKIKKMTVAIGGGPKGGPFPPTEPPAHLDWDFWLGQAPKVPYVKERCHADFRWWFDYSGGKMTDWGAHHVDIAHWALGAIDTGPVSFEGTAEFPGIPGGFETAVTFNVDCRFEDGTQMIICDKTEGFDNGVLIEGEKGRIFVNRERLTGKPVEELASNPLPEDALQKVYKGRKPTGHMDDFFACVKSRDLPVSDVFSHHRALTSCHLANIAIRLGRKIQWDPKAEQIVGDDEARSWQAREQRKGYEIKV